MKSLKKTLVLLVVFSMILSAVMPAFAATDIYGLDCEEEVARLEALEVVSGYEDGTFGPEKTITRAEMAVILCKMVGIDEVTAEENKVVPSKFSDVKVGEWYTGFVNVAAGKGLLSGFPDGTFRPNEQLTMNQVLTLCVNALGRGEYVSEMGTWPANYIAEATKLGLLDGVKTSDANRGNVAMIVWNTLEAPYVWDVTNTEYEGTINLGNSTRSLLSIYFRDFSYDAGTYYTVEGEEKFAYADRLLKEAEYVQVMEVPSTDGDLGEKQLVLAKTEDTDEYFASLLTSIKANKKPRGTDDEEWTAVNAKNEIVAYAPSFDELDSFFGKIVTVIFGKDNEVISIRVIDETVEEQYLTAYKDEKLTIGGETYKFADEADVYVNTQPMTSENVAADTAMGNIASELGIDFAETYGKVIEANVVLNSKGKVTRLDLFVSGNYDLFLTKEAIVAKVKDEVITLETTTGEDEIDYSEDGDYAEEDDRPRVIKDGAIITMEEIAAGDVLTYYYTTNNDGDEVIKTIYVASNSVAGELTRVSKSDLRMTVEGEKYFYSMGKDAKFLFTDDKISDADKKEDATDYVGENVTLYLNVYGEYVLMAAEKAEENWVFGIVTDVRDLEEDEEDDDIFYIPVRILLADGTTSREYTFILDEEADDKDHSDWEEDVKDLEDEFIAFAPTANKEIEYFDAYVVKNVNLLTKTKDAYDAKVYATSTDKDLIDTDRQRIDSKIFSDGKTVIFNTAERATAGSTDKASVSKDWDSLLTNADKLAYETILVYEKDAKTISYVLIDVAEDKFATSDALYAVVETDDYKEKNGSSTEKYVDLLLPDEETAETFEAKDLDTNYVVGKEEMFVEYTLSGSKLETATLLVDVPAFKELKGKEVVNNKETEIAESAETKLAVELKNVVDGKYKVATNETNKLLVIANTKEVAATPVEGKEVTVTTVTTKTAALADSLEAGVTYVKLIPEVKEVKAVPAHYVRVSAPGEGILTVVADADPDEHDPDFEVELGTVNTANDAADDVDAELAYTAKAGHWVKFVKAVDAVTPEAEKYVTCDKEDEGALLVIADTKTVDTKAEDGEIRLADVEKVTEGLTLEAGVSYVVFEGTSVATKKYNFKVVDTQKLLLEYEDEDVDYTFNEVEVDEDVVVYDLSGDAIKTMTFEELRDLVAADGSVYVIPFANSDADEDTANVLVVIAK